MLTLVFYICPRQQLQFQLHHLSYAHNALLHHSRTLESVLRQYNLAFAPAAAAASVVLSAQMGGPPVSPSSTQPSSLHTSLSPSPSPSPSVARNHGRRMSSRSNTSDSSSLSLPPRPHVVLPSPQVEVPYPTLPDPGSTSEEDVSLDVVMSVLKNPGGLGVGRAGSGSSRKGSVDSNIGSGGGSVGSRLEETDEERSNPGGSPSLDGQGGEENGTPELVFASIPSYDVHSRPRSTTGGSCTRHRHEGIALDDVEVRTTDADDQGRGRSSEKSALHLTPGSPKTPTAGAHPRFHDGSTPTGQAQASGMTEASSSP